MADYSRAHSAVENPIVFGFRMSSPIAPYRSSTSVWVIRVRIHRFLSRVRGQGGNVNGFVHTVAFLTPFFSREMDPGPGSRGSRPALMRLSDLGAMRHCTPPFL